MNLLMVSEMAILIDPNLKRHHDTVNGIIMGYCRFAGRRIYRRVTKSLYKLAIPKGELGQRKSDQVYDPRIHTNRCELLSSFIGVHSCALVVQKGC